MEDLLPDVVVPNIQISLEPPSWFRAPTVGFPTLTPVEWSHSGIGSFLIPLSWAARDVHSHRVL